MKYKKLVLILAVILIPVTLYVSVQKKSDDEPTSFENINIEKGPAPEWLQTLPEYNFNEIEISDGKYSYKYSKEISANGNVARTVEYTKNNEHKYSGTIKLSFSSKEDSYIETIPKSFASHVDQLNFSIEPSRIINPDPVVEFTNMSGDLEINSKETIEENEVEKNIEDQLIEKELKNCKGLENTEIIACVLQIIPKYRDNETLNKELSSMNLAELLGGVSVAVLDKNLDKCDYIKNSEEKYNCYEYGYQVLVAECNTLSDKAYRDCARKISWQLPDMEIRRLFCHHIDDKKMYNECQGTTEMNVCDEIQNEDQRLICQINIAKTKKNIKACESIEDNEGKDLCRSVLGIDKQDKRICDIVKDPYFNGECNLKVAMAKNDKTICQDIKHENARGVCFSYFALVKQDFDREMCDGINEVFLKDMCELGLAIKNKNTKKCEEYTGEDESTRLLCYMIIAVKHNDASICSKLTNDTQDEELQVIAEKSIDDCFSQIAINTKDKELCNKIEDTDLKNACIEKLEKPTMPSITCSDVPAMICPSERKGGGFEELDGENGTQIRCSYNSASSNLVTAPLHNEMHRLCLSEGKYCQKWEKHGMYKKYYKSGKIQVATQYTNGVTDGYRINCSETGELTYCNMFDNGKDLGTCMP